MNITKQMKILAVESATIKVYQERVDAIIKQSKEAVEHFVINLPKNVESIAFAKTVPQQFHSLLQLSSLANFNYMTKKGDGEEATEQTWEFYSNFPTFYKYGDKDKDYIRPFSNTKWSSNSFKFTKSYLLADHSYANVEQSAPFIEIAQKRIDLSQEIQKFMEDSYLALMPIKTFKQLQECLPAFTRFFPEPVKKNALINVELNEKVSMMLLESA